MYLQRQVRNISLSGGGPKPNANLLFSSRRKEVSSDGTVGLLKAHIKAVKSQGLHHRPTSVSEIADEQELHGFYSLFCSEIISSCVMYYILIYRQKPHQKERAYTINLPFRLDLRLIYVQVLEPIAALIRTELSDVESPALVLRAIFQTCLLLAYLMTTVGLVRMRP